MKSEAEKHKVCSNESDVKRRSSVKIRSVELRGDLTLLAPTAAEC